jgi:hypothetical protein
LGHKDFVDRASTEHNARIRRILIIVAGLLPSR